MGRPKLKEEDKKGKLGISLSKELIKELDLITNNKSQFIVMDCKNTAQITIYCGGLQSLYITLFY